MVMSTRRDDDKRGMGAYVSESGGSSEHVENSSGMLSSGQTQVGERREGGRQGGEGGDEDDGVHSPPSLLTQICTLFGHDHAFDTATSTLLRRCLPIFVVPEVDEVNGNGLCGVVVEPMLDRQQLGVYVVYQAESSYSYRTPSRVNRVATFFYRTFNRMLYRRTADRDYLWVKGVHDSGHAHLPPFRAISTTDYAGRQTWSRGDACVCPGWFSVMRHYGKVMHLHDLLFAHEGDSREEGEEEEGRGHHHHPSHPYPNEDERRGREGGGEVSQPFLAINSRESRPAASINRPLIFVNTCNHEMSERDNNPAMEKVKHWQYPVVIGTNDQAEAVTKRMEKRCSLFSCGGCFPSNERRAFQASFAAFACNVGCTDVTNMIW